MGFFPTARLNKIFSPAIGIFEAGEVFKIGEGKLGEAQVCKRYQRVAWAETGHRQAIFSRLRCKQWSCPFCAKRNQWEWRNWLLKRLPEVSGDWWILTLTANSQTRGHWQSLDNIRKHLDAFFKRVKRVFGEIQYVRVYEKHPTSQAIHCHIIISGVTPFVALGYSAKLQPMAFGVIARTGRNGVWAIKTWVKKTAMALKMGYIADIQKIEGEPQRAVWYVTKYLTKAQEKLHIKGLRHVQVTKGIGSPKYADNDLVWCTAAYVTASMVGEKTKMTDLNTGAIIDQNFWEGHGFYPNED